MSTATLGLTTYIESTLLIPVIVAILTSFFTYYFGFNQYLKQRRWEIIRKTYIEGGIERVINETDQISTACYQNYAQAKYSFQILIESIDAPEKWKGVTENIFLEMEGVKLAPNYGVLKLTVFDEFLPLLVTKMWVELQQLNENIRHVGRQCVKDYFNEQEKKTEKERAVFLQQNKDIVSEEWNKTIRKYETLKGQLLRLQIETDKIRLTDVDDLNKIAQKAEVKKILEEIKRQYADEIKI